MIKKQHYMRNTHTTHQRPMLSKQQKIQRSIEIIQSKELLDTHTHYVTKHYYDKRYAKHVYLYKNIEIRSLICGRNRCNLKQIVSEIDPSGEMKIWIEMPSVRDKDKPVKIYSVNKDVLHQVANRLYKLEDDIIRSRNLNMLITKQERTYDIQSRNEIYIDFRDMYEFLIPKYKKITIMDFEKGGRIDKSKIINRVREMFRMKGYMQGKIIILIEEQENKDLKVTLFSKIKEGIDLAERIIRVKVYEHQYKDSVFTEHLKVKKQELAKATYQMADLYTISQLNYWINELNFHRMVEEYVHRILRIDYNSLIRQGLVIFTEGNRKLNDILYEYSKNEKSAELWYCDNTIEIPVTHTIVAIKEYSTKTKQIEIMGYHIIYNKERQFVKMLRLCDLRFLCCKILYPQHKIEEEMDEITKEILKPRSKKVHFNDSKNTIIPPLPPAKEEAETEAENEFVFSSKHLKQIEKWKQEDKQEKTKVKCGECSPYITGGNPIQILGIERCKLYDKSELKECSECEKLLCQQHYEKALKWGKEYRSWKKEPFAMCESCCWNEIS